MTLVFFNIKPKGDDNMEDKPKNDLERKTFEMEFLIEKDERFKDVKLKAVTNPTPYFFYNFETKSPTVALQLSTYLRERNFRLFKSDFDIKTEMYQLRFSKK